MGVPALPGLGDFSVPFQGNSGHVCLPRNERMRALLDLAWVDEMHRALKSKLKGRAYIELVKTAEGTTLRVYKVTPSNGRTRGKNKGRFGGLQREIMKAIKAFIRKKRGRSRHSTSGHNRSEQRLTVRRPEVVYARRAFLPV